MNIKFIIAAISLLLITINGFAQYHYIQKLSGNASIAMPDTPKIITKKGVTQYIATYNDVIFTASTTDVKGGLRDIINNTTTDSIYSGFLEGLLGASKGKLLYRDKIKINGNEAMQFGYTATVKNQQIYGYYRVVSLNDTLITCGIMSSDSISKDHKALTNFFDNFKLVNAEKIASVRTEKVAYKTGQVVGTLLIISLFVGIGFGIVLLIKKLVYKKEA